METTTTSSTSTAESRRVTVAEAAVELRVCRETIRRLIRQGRVPAIKVGAVYRLAMKDVEHALSCHGKDADDE